MNSDQIKLYKYNKNIMGKLGAFSYNDINANINIYIGL